MNILGLNLLTISTAGFLLFSSTTFGAGKKITVDPTGKGNYKTVQEAIAAVSDKSVEQTIIHINAGTYEGPVVVSKSNISLEGDGVDKTIITYPYNVRDPIPPEADKFNPGVHIKADDFHAQNLTMQNTSGDHGQALALRVDGDRVSFKNCRMLGWQDTVMINHGRQYFKDCYIEGRVDFIYGDGTAVFDHCEIHSKNGGYLTAASTPQEHPYGFVFLDCKLTGDPKPWIDPTGMTTPKPSKGSPQAYLGRPWRPYGSVTFIKCVMGDHIRPEGWHNWGKVENESTARYSEYGNTGPGAATEKRVPWAKQLSKEEADKITTARVLAGSDNWKP